MVALSTFTLSSGTLRKIQIRIPVYCLVETLCKVRKTQRPYEPFNFVKGMGHLFICLFHWTALMMVGLSAFTLSSAAPWKTPIWILVSLGILCRVKNCWSLLLSINNKTSDTQQLYLQCLPILGPNSQLRLLYNLIWRLLDFLLTSCKTQMQILVYYFIETICRFNRNNGLYHHTQGYSIRGVVGFSPFILSSAAPLIKTFSTDVCLHLLESIQSSRLVSWILQR